MHQRPEDDLVICTGELYRTTRRRKGMTQCQVCRESGIAQADVSRFERGRGNPRIKNIGRLAAAIGCRMTVAFM